MDCNFDNTKILCANGNISIYKLDSQNKDVRKMYRFLMKQPDDHVSPWGEKYNLKQCHERLKLNDKGEIILYGILFSGKTEICSIEKKMIDLDQKIIGLIGINYNKKYFIKEYSGNYFTHVIVDHQYLKRGIGSIAMKLLLEHLKKNNTFNIDRVYAGIYCDNVKSINFHMNLGFKEEKIADNIMILVYLFE